MEHLKMHSADGTAANIDRLAELFPSVVTETRDAEGNVTRGIDFDLLRQELSDHVVEGPQERYQLDWPGKREALFAANAPIAKTLRPQREESVDFDTTKNIFIEGDNLDALKLLQESYLGKVKLIYIDPPYNTGHDFVYNDSFAKTSKDYLERSGQRDEDGVGLTSNPESNGRFHSDWLSMMYPRLKLARNLLTEDGVIIAAIDDGEHANLRAAMDQIFGSDNFLANAVWQGSGKNDARFTAGGVDYMLIYARSRRALIANDVRFKSPKAGYEDVLEAGRNAWDLSDGDQAKATNLFREWWKTKPDVEAGLRAYSEIDSNGNIFTRDNLASPNPRKNLMYDVLHPTTLKPVPMHRNGWRLTKDAMDQRIKDGHILFGEDETTTPRFKRLLRDMSHQAIRPVISQERAPASDSLSRLMGARVFDYPKDIDVLKTWINATTSGDKHAIILDFFAGSGSTSHAVMTLNAEDGGHRRWIAVQLPEELESDSAAMRAGHQTISSLCRERIRRSGNELRETMNHAAPHPDLGFRAFRIDTTNMNETTLTPSAYDQDNVMEFVSSVKSGRTAEDLLFQVMLDWGLELSLPIERTTIAGREVFIVDGGALVACFEGNATEELAREIAALQPLRAVFRDSAFTSDALRINVEQIFTEHSSVTDVKVI
ncbi:site-specific DNA-methyltransferase [Brachybacterium timonense]|uniref:site-specific DNA-methyltransferase n=1 Tax=Brachybacterium timonense TaxID=2050896 RepID=UPI001482259E|nr:site-specific DNA-methyltransferase [Brachybacterium timonense]